MFVAFGILSFVFALFFASYLLQWVANGNKVFALVACLNALGFFACFSMAYFSQFN